MHSVRPFHVPAALRAVIATAGERHASDECRRNACPLNGARALGRLADNAIVRAHAHAERGLRESQAIARG